MSNIDLNISITLRNATEGEANEFAAKLAAAFGGDAPRPSAQRTDAGASPSKTQDDSLDSEGAQKEERPVASRKTYCHDAASKRLFTLEKGDTLPSPESGVETIAKSTYEKLEAEYAAASTPQADSAAGDETKEYTAAEIKAAVSKYAAEHGTVLAKKLISSMGVEKLSEVPAEKYGELMAAVEGESADDDLDL